MGYLLTLTHVQWHMYAHVCKYTNTHKIKNLKNDNQSHYQHTTKEAKSNYQVENGAWFFNISY